MTLQQLLTKLRDKELEAIENGGVAEVHFIDLADAQRAIVELIERDGEAGKHRPKPADHGRNGD